MNTQTELREALNQHAHDLDGIPTADRLGQIHGRVRGIRRRRRATVAGVAAAAVAVVGFATFLPRSHDAAPTDRELGGHTAPKTMDSLGFTYDFTSGAEGDKKVTIRLAESDDPRLVSWAATDGPVKVRGVFDVDGDGTGPDVTTSKVTDFSTFSYVSPGEPVDLTVTSDEGKVAAAVYDLAELPASDADGPVFYRHDVVGSKLLASGFGAPGQTEVTVPFTMPQTTLRTSEFCYGVPDSYWVWVSIAGSGPSGTTCQQGAPFDPGSAGGTSPDGWEDAAGDPVRPGQRVTARVWVTKGNESSGAEPPASSAPGVHLGIGLYADPAPAVTVGDWEVLPLIEYDGHTYAYADSASSQPGDAKLTWTVTAGDAPTLVESLSTNTRNGTVWVMSGGEQVGPRFGSAAGGGHRGGLEVIRDQTKTYTYLGRNAVGPKTILGLVTYERVD